MKKIKFFLSCLSMLALAVSFTACDNNDPEPEPEIPAPVVTLEKGTAGETTLGFTLTTEKAQEAAWLCVEKGVGVNAEKVLTKGQKVEANKTLELVAEGLIANTEYEIYAVAKNGTMETLSEALTMKTLEAKEPVVQEPKVSLKAGTITENSVTFSITTENVEQVKWQIVAKGAELKAEDVLANGEEVDANTTVECVAEELAAETDYTIYAAVKAGEQMLLSNALNVKTLKAGEEPVESPVVTLAPVSVTENSVTFAVTSEKAETVQWIVLPEAMLEFYGEITVDHVFNGVNEVEPNTTVEATQEYLEAGTAYLVYAAAKAGDIAVLSEPLKMTTEAGEEPEPEYIELPVPVFASATLYTGAGKDKYTFMLADEPGALYLQFDLYTEPGLNGQIEEDYYPIDGNMPNMIDKSTLMLMVEGMPITVTEGELYVLIYEDSNGKCATVMGEIYAEGQELPYALMYDGSITMMGLKNNEEAKVEEITFSHAYHTRPTDDYLNPLPGEFNVFFQEGDMQVTLCFNAQDKVWLAGDYYTVGKDASIAGPTGAWVNSEKSSIESGIPPIPEQLEGGVTMNDYYVRVETNLDLGPMDNNFADMYHIEFYVKSKGIYSAPKVVKGTYDGPLGFNVGEETQLPNLELAYNLFTLEQAAGNMNFSFSNNVGGSLSLVTTGGALPTEVGAADWTWYQIQSGSANEPYLSKGTVAAKGRLGVKFLGEVYDGSTGMTRPEYQFTVEGPEMTFHVVDAITGIGSDVTYTSKSEWRSFLLGEGGGDDTPSVVEASFSFNSGVATTTSDGTKSEVELKDAKGNTLNLTFHVDAAYAGAGFLYGSGTSFTIADKAADALEPGFWIDAATASITYNGVTYALPASDPASESYNCITVTTAQPGEDLYIISLNGDIECENGLTITGMSYRGPLYSGGVVVEKPVNDFSKVASGYKTLTALKDGSTYIVRLSSFTNGDMVFYIKDVDTIFGKWFTVGKEITMDSYMFQPAVELDDDGIKSMIVSGEIRFNQDKNDATKITVLTGYDDGEEDTRLYFENDDCKIMFDSGDKGWTATFQK